MRSPTITESGADDQMSPFWTELRRAPMWRIALGAGLVVVALSILVPEGPQSVAGIAAAALGFMLFALILVALKGAEAWTLLGLMVVLGCVLGTADLAVGTASAAYVVALTVGAHVLCGLRVPTGQPAARPTLTR
jgi:hypothetical protein